MRYLNTYDVEDAMTDFPQAVYFSYEPMDSETVSMAPIKTNAPRLLIELAVSDAAKHLKTQRFKTRRIAGGTMLRVRKGEQ